MKYQTKSKRCLGIDPVLANCGWAFVVKSPRGYRLVADGLIKADSKETTGDRLLTIYKAFSEVVGTHLPDRIAIERCYHNKNVSSRMTTGAVIGVVQLVDAQYRGDVLESHRNRSNLRAVGGSVSKEQVNRMMCKIFIAKVSTIIPRTLRHLRSQAYSETDAISAHASFASRGSPFINFSPRRLDPAEPL